MRKIDKMSVSQFNLFAQETTESKISGSKGLASNLGGRFKWLGWGICLLLAQLPLNAQVSVPTEVLQREEVGDLAAASDLLTPFVKEKDPEHRTTDAGVHLSLLQETIRGLHLASIYHREGDDGRAKVALENILTKLDPVRDGNLIVALARSLKVIQAETLQAEEKEAIERLTAARSLLEAEKYDDALAAYDEVAKLPASQIPTQVIREARLGKLKAVSAKARAQSPTFWGEIGASGLHGARTVTQWLVYLAAVGLLGLLFAGARGRIPVRPGTVVQFQDLTASSSEQEQRNEHLVREFLQKVTTGASNQVPSGEDFEDFDGKVLGHLRLEVDPLANLQTFVNDEASLHVGPISLQPRQLLRYLGSLFQKPPESILRGSLTSEGDRVTLNVEHRVTAGISLASGCWEVSETGEGARVRAIQRMAMRVAFELSRSRVTDKWESFDLYRQAMELLAQEFSRDGREEELGQARGLLRKSIVHDPSNWLARFHLATLERTLGNDDMAAQHFEFLERLLVAKKGKSGSISHFLHRHPEFVYTVQYNRAVSLAKEENQEDRRRALEIFDDLVEKVARTSEISSPSSAPSPSPASNSHMIAVRPRFFLGRELGLKIEILARSARAAALVRDLDRSGPDEKDAFFQRIKLEKDWFVSLGLDHGNPDWGTLALGYAVALNAFGQACLKFGYYNHSVNAFREAMVVAPEFVDAFNNLAAVYLDQRRKQDPEWALKLEDLLRQVLVIRGSNQKAHLLLGRYYSLPAIGRFEEARQHFGNASRLSWSYFYLAEILIHQDHNREEALKILRRSIFMDKWPDRRYVTFIECALDVSLRHGGDRPLLREALQLAKKYAEEGTNRKPREQKFRHELLGKV